MCNFNQYETNGILFESMTYLFGHICFSLCDADKSLVRILSELYVLQSGENRISTEGYITPVLRIKSLYMQHHPSYLYLPSDEKAILPYSY